MFRRALMLVMCLCLMIPSAMAAPAPLGQQEMTEWRDAMWETMKGADMVSVPSQMRDSAQTETWLYEFTFGIGTLSEAIAEAAENPVAEVEIITDDIACPRGIVVGDSLQKVLDAYPNENIELTGDASYAVLYTEAAQGWGWLLRRNQTIEGVEYVVAVPAEMQGFYQEISLLYVVSHGQVTAIRASGFDELITAEEHEANLFTVENIAKVDTFSQQAQDAETGLKAADLTFAGLSFVTATPEDCIAALGAPLEDVTTTSPDLRTLTYGDVLIESTQRDGAWRLAAVLVTAGDMAGPKDLRIGDTLESVFGRFGEGDTEDSLMYRCTDEQGNEYAISCSFFGDVLTEYLIYRL